MIIAKRIHKLCIITMKLIYLNFLYVLNTTIELVMIKVLTHFLKINNFTYFSLIKSCLLPIMIYKLYHNYRDPKWFEISIGLLDYFEAFLSFASFVGISLGEYVTFRTSAIFFNAILIYVYSKKVLVTSKYIGISLIFIACLLLLIFDSKGSVIDGLICLLSALLYSMISFIIEIKTNQDDLKITLYWSKTISSIISVIVAIMIEYDYKNINNIYKTNDNKIYLIFVSLLIGTTELYYYYLKIQIISTNSTSESGSVSTNFLDIIRRFLSLIAGITIFKETYDVVIYLSYSIMIIGSIIGLVNINEIITNINVYFKKYKQMNDQNVNLSDVIIK